MPFQTHDNLCAVYHECDPWGSTYNNNNQYEDTSPNTSVNNTVYVYFYK